MLDFYRFAVYLGFAGLACMAVLGVANSGSGHGHSAARGHGGGRAGGRAHANGNALPSQSHGSAHATHHGGGIRATRSVKGARGAKGSKTSFFLSFLSPQNFFSLMLGFGATGILCKQLVAVEPMRAIISVVGAVLFEKCLVTPVWNGWLRFASNPARTLESAVYEEATAITAFDADGCGLICIDLDGHEVRVLARLSPPERQNPLRVRAGDRLFVESIDTARNSCVVSRPERI
ncbi:MAG TPA: hypothetical protein VF627_12695 [Abditibacterium sp.]|jgi:hypothetical protein